MKIVSILAILLAFFGPGCSTQSSHEPVTVTFLDIEYDTPDRLTGLAQDLQAFTRETGIRVRRLPRLSQFPALRRRKLVSTPTSPFDFIVGNQVLSAGEYM